MPATGKHRDVPVEIEPPAVRVSASRTGEGSIANCESALLERKPVASRMTCELPGTELIVPTLTHTWPPAPSRMMVPLAIAYSDVAKLRVDVAGTACPLGKPVSHPLVV